MSFWCFASAFGMLELPEESTGARVGWKKKTAKKLEKSHQLKKPVVIC